ncbi:hypothetical protein GCM10027169_30960 [Gordonia jinhuaensis]|uniref:Uncharacterized protein n=1 Tax=Gordonia jinhuaensis TaxID=1517702 RepID=A0A916T7W4_9ACTN|nr:hypothetical protein [Gordonia jinhuaensis]GGB35067.1 hypothetical protein GCM10011489_23870 [Gordonia jinhuaensis]
MSFAELRANVRRANSRRRMYARINAVRDPSVRDELLVIAQRHEDSLR